MITNQLNSVVSCILFFIHVLTLPNTIAYYDSEYSPRNEYLQSDGEPDSYFPKKENKIQNYLEPFEYKRVCYFANWAAKRRSPISRCTPEDVDPFLCTHINFAFGRVGEDLTIKPYEEDDTQGWTGGPGMYQRVTNLRKNNTRLKIMLSIGGWTHASKGFNEVVKDEKSIKTFVKNATAYLRKYEFDGLDIDWEYPGAKDRGAEKDTKRGFTNLVRELREEFEKEAYEKDKNRLLLSTAVGAARHRIEEGYEVEELCKYFDFINVMSYDFHGSWDEVTGHNSPLYGRADEPEKFKDWNVNTSMYIWAEMGCPKEKLILGISAYGRGFSMYSENQTHVIGKSKASASEAGQYTMEPGVYAYYEICEILKKDKAIKLYWHPEHEVPYLYRPGLWIGYDNLESIINKVKYLKKHGFGGVIVWSLDMDDKDGSVCNEGPYPVMNTIKKELLIMTSTKPPVTQPTTSEFALGFWSRRQMSSKAASIKKQIILFIISILSLLLIFLLQ